MNCVLGAILVLLAVDLTACEPGIFSSYMGVDYQDGGFGKYIFTETKVRLWKFPRTKKPKSSCHRSGTFPDPIDPGSFFTCVFSFAEGFKFSRHSCPPFYTFSEDKGSCTIYYDEYSSGYGGNDTIAENDSDNIADIAELPSLGELSTISLTPI